VVVEEGINRRDIAPDHVAPSGKNLGGRGRPPPRGHCLGPRSPGRLVRGKIREKWADEGVRPYADIASDHVGKMTLLPLPGLHHFVDFALHQIALERADVADVELAIQVIGFV